MGAIQTLFGASRGDRTHDLRFTKPLLYQLSYAGNFPKLLESSRRPS